MVSGAHASKSVEFSSSILKYIIYIIYKFQTRQLDVK